MKPTTKRRWEKFRKTRRSYFSLWCLTLLLLVSFGAELWINPKPLVLRFEGATYFPAFKYYPGQIFGEEVSAEVDYRVLVRGTRYQKPGNWALFAPIHWGPLESQSLATPPPHPPSHENILGTDDRGRDLLARLVYGFRNSFLFASVSWILTAILSYLIGGIQGYLGGRVDLFAQRTVEIWSSLPVLYVLLFMMAIFPSNLWLLLAVWAAFSWVGLAGYVRVEVLRIRKLEYVSAARAAGASHGRVLMKHVLPNALTPLITFTPFLISASIVSLAALDYLGLGLPPPTPSWGELLHQGKENLRSWWVGFFPFLALFGTTLLLNFIGEGLRRAMDSRS